MKEPGPEPQKRQPFFGYNAKAFAIQFAIGIALLFFSALGGGKDEKADSRA